MNEPLIPLAMTTAIVLVCATASSGGSFFCTNPEPLEVGTYRPDDSSEELQIAGRCPSEVSVDFWYDDVSGDYQPALEDGRPGTLEPAKLQVPLGTIASGGLEGIVLCRVTFGACLPAPMGARPAEGEEQP